MESLLKRSVGVKCAPSAFCIVPQSRLTSREHDDIFRESGQLPILLEKSSLRKDVISSQCRLHIANREQGIAEAQQQLSTLQVRDVNVVRWCGTGVDSAYSGRWQT